MTNNKKKIHAVNELLGVIPANELKDFIFKMQNDLFVSGMTEGLTELGRNDLGLKYHSLFEFAKSLEALK